MNYTKKQLDAIDALCAECVMGYVRFPYLMPNAPVLWCPKDKVYLGEATRFEPTISWSAAGQVVEKMRKHFKFRTGECFNIVVVEFAARNDNGTRNGRSEVETNNLPLAITIAAIRACGGGERLDRILEDKQ